MKKLLVIPSLIFSGSALAHVSQTSGAVHQFEHLLWALLLVIPIAWVVISVVNKLKQKNQKR